MFSASSNEDVENSNPNSSLQLARVKLCVRVLPDESEVDAQKRRQADRQDRME